MRLETIGLSGGHDESSIRGNVKARSFSVIYRRDGCVIALDCVNAAPDYVQGKALITSRVILLASDLAHGQQVTERSGFSELSRAHGSSGLSYLPHVSGESCAINAAPRLVLTLAKLPDII